MFEIAHARMNFVEVLDYSNSAYQTFLKALAAHVRQLNGPIF